MANSNEAITKEQLSTLYELLVLRGLIMDRTYYDYTHLSVNFRCNVNPLNTDSVEVLDIETQSVRYAIMDDGTVVDRNTDRRFIGILR